MICGAKTRKGWPCRRPAGWGTNHPGRGRCKLHGGASPGALVTGEYETIWLDQLTPEERELYERIDPDVAAQIVQEIRLLTIRERRMLARIKRLAEGPELVTESAEMGYTEKGDISLERQEAAENRIQRIEEALTRVQERKAKYLELLHKMTAEAETLDAVDKIRQLLADAHAYGAAVAESGGDEEDI